MRTAVNSERKLLAIFIPPKKKFGFGERNTDRGVFIDTDELKASRRKRRFSEVSRIDGEPGLAGARGMMIWVRFEQSAQSMRNSGKKLLFWVDEEVRSSVCASVLFGTSIPLRESGSHHRGMLVRCRAADLGSRAGESIIRWMKTKRTAPMRRPLRINK